MSEPIITEPDEMWVRAFPNGSSWYDWLARNCERCSKSSPEIGDRERDTCDLETRIWDEGMIHSQWSPETVARVGWDEENHRPTQCKEMVPA